MIARSRLPRGVLWGLVLLGMALGVAPCWAGPEARRAWLDVWVPDDGIVVAGLSGDIRPTPAAAVIRALQQALGDGAVIEPHTGSGPDGFRVSARGGAHFRRRGVVVTGQLDLEPLRQELTRAGVPSLAVSIHHTASGVSRCTGAEREGSLDGYEVHYSLLTPVATAPRFIRLEFGYPPAELLRIFGPMALPFLLPVLIALGLRRRALRDGVHDPAGAWFRYARTLQWVLLGAVLGALSALISSPANDFLIFALPDLEEPWPGILNVLGPLLLPLAAALVCGVLSHTVSQRLRGVEATRGEVVRQSLWTLALCLCCWLLLLIAIWKSTTDMRSAVRWFLAACVVGGLGIRFIRRAAGSTLQPVGSGELRERLIALAAQAGVKLNQVYVMPARKGRQANAFAATGGQVVLTDYLLQHLTRREVDAIVAHELTHLKRRDPLRLLLAILLAIALPIAILCALGGLFGSRLEPFAWALPLVLPCGVPICFFVSRRCERAADAGAVALTGDPEALITALAKSTHLNTLPMHWGKWDERLITHPSTMRRAEAIAARAGIASERLQEMLRELDADADRHALPETVVVETPSCYAVYKSETLRRYAWVLLAVDTLTPAAVVALARVAGWAGAARWSTPFVAFVITFALTLVAATWVLAGGAARMRRQISERLEQEGVLVEAASGAFVGLAPAATPRLYDGFSTWDVGFLFLLGDRLCYLGEVTRFALRREQIRAIRVGAGLPGWWPARRVCVTWHGETHDMGGTFSLYPDDASTLWAKRGARALAGRLQRWQDKPVSSSTLPPALGNLPLPALGEVPSSSPRIRIDLRALCPVFLERGLIALAAAWLLNLPLAPSDGGDAWWAVAVSVSMRPWDWLPYWCYREPADASPPYQADLPPPGPRRSDTPSHPEGP